MALTSTACWTIFIGVVLGLTVFSMVDGADAASIPSAAQYNQEFVSLGETLPPRLRKIYYALASLADNYPSLDERALRDRDMAPLYNSGIKRQDVDHVFLRFGRRRR